MFFPRHLFFEPLFCSLLCPCCLLMDSVGLDFRDNNFGVLFSFASPSFHVELGVFCRRKCENVVGED